TGVTCSWVEQRSEARAQGRRHVLQQQCVRRRRYLHIDVVAQYLTKCLQLIRGVALRRKPICGARFGRGRGTLLAARTERRIRSRLIGLVVQNERRVVGSADGLETG